MEGVDREERKIATIGAWAQRDSSVPSLNGEVMIEECGAVVKFEVFMGEILEFVRIDARVMFRKETSRLSQVSQVSHTVVRHRRRVTVVCH